MLHTRPGFNPLFGFHTTLLVILAVLTVAAAVQAQSPPKIVIGYSAVQAPIAPLWIAQNLGLFNKYGIEPKLVFVRTTSVHIAGLISGSIDMSYGGDNADNIFCN